MFRLEVIKKRLKSLVFAGRGLRYLVITEDSFKFQLLFSIMFIIAGFYFDISSLEWCAQLIVMALVLSVEGLNSSIELLADYIQPNHDKKIGKIKDVAAGAVLVSGIFACVIVFVIYIPYFMALI
jgi:diacylglycerol kinase (ATP)